MERKLSASKEATLYLGVEKAPTKAPSVAHFSRPFLLSQSKLGWCIFWCLTDSERWCLKVSFIFPASAWYYCIFGFKILFSIFIAPMAPYIPPFVKACVSDRRKNYCSLGGCNTDEGLSGSVVEVRDGC